MNLRSTLLSFAIALGTVVPIHSQALFGRLHEMLPRDGWMTTAVLLGDVDGDGDRDAFLGNHGHDRLYLNDGHGRFTSSPNQPPTGGDWQATESLALVDLDGDTDLDVLVGNEDGPNRTWVNDGTGVFTQGPLASGGGTTQSVAVGDVDADGDVDALYGQLDMLGPLGYVGGRNSLVLNDGAGTLWDGGSLPLHEDYTHAVELADLDGDGDLDALVGNDSTNRLYLGNGAALFVDASGQLPPSVGVTRALEVGDVDGDGDLDVALGEGESFGTAPGQVNHLLLNDGTGGFAEAVGALPAHVQVTETLKLFDTDADGDLDLFAGNVDIRGADPANRLYRNDGAGVFADAAGAVPLDPTTTASVEVGDVDGDGDVDMLLGNGARFAGGAQDRLYLNDGAGTFTDVTLALPTDDDWSEAFALGDLDGDGDLDAFIGSFNPNVNGTENLNRFYRNDGAGYFTSEPGIPQFPSAATSVALGDVDGDGDLDVFLGGAGAFTRYRQNVLLLNDGLGTFTDATDRLPRNMDDTIGITLGDLDGDGDLDALVSYHGAQNRAYRNDGSGTFAEIPGAFPLVPPDSETFVLGDVDGDGDLDALFGEMLFQNDGTGVFSDVTWTLPANFVARWLVDVDGDGDLDALEAEALYLNDGTGGFVDVSSAAPGPRRISAVGDVDEDGDVDALVSDDNGRRRLYLNDGSAFVEAPGTIPSDFGSQIIPPNVRVVGFGDLDGDDDLDAYFSNLHQDRVWRNLLRQVAWSAVPRIGQPFTMDVFGPPAGPWFLGRAFGRAQVPSAFGTLLIDPTSLVLFASGFLDGDGRGSSSFAVPADPALVGLDVFWQGAVGPPLRLTNLEIATLSAL